MWRFNHSRFHPAARLLISAAILFALFCTTPANPTQADDDGFALAFDGVNANVVLAETAYIMAPTWVNTKTVELWVKPEGQAVTCGMAGVAACDYILADRPEWWGITRGIISGQDRIWVYNWDGNMDQIGIPYTPGEWVHIALVHSGGILSAYKNGVLISSILSGLTLQPNYPPNDPALPVLYLGGTIFNAERIYTFQGQIDEVRLWNTARSSAEINANMRLLLSGSEAGLAAYYQMSDGAGLILTDDSGHNWDGTLLDSGLPHVPPNGFPPQWVASTAFDVIPPSVTINQALGQDDPANSGPITFDVVFSEPVTGFVTGDVTFSGTAGATIATVSGSGASYTVQVSGMTGSGSVIASIPAGVAQNTAEVGNSASISSDNSVTYDATPPTVTINRADGQADPTNTSPVNFTVVFSEAVDDFGDLDVTLEGTAGADIASVTGSGTTYSVAVSGMTGSGTVIVSIAAGTAHDAAGNPNTAGIADIVTYDITAPTVTINQADGQADPTNTSPVNFTVIFDEEVTDFDDLDVTLEGTAGPTSANVTGSGTIYNVAVSGMTANGTIIAYIAAGAAHDSAGNLAGSSTSTDNTVIYDFWRLSYLPLILR